MNSCVGIKQCPKGMHELTVANPDASTEFKTGCVEDEMTLVVIQAEAVLRILLVIPEVP